MNQRKPYIIDTNILISFHIFTPMNIHVTFWDQLSEAVENGEIIIIREVVNECTKPPEIKKWVRSQKIIETDDVHERATEINNEYRLITEKEGIKKSEADPIIIAYAEKNNGIVFTQEAENDPKKMPDVCKALSIDCQRWPGQVFKDIKFKRI